MRIVENELLSKHTTFKIGGPCTMYFPETAQELAALVCEGDCFILGSGSNLLAPDEGYAGRVVKTSLLSSIEVEGEYIRAQCGASLARVATAAAKEGLTGLEFAAGIPGSLGGGLCMNAGAYGGELSQTVVSSVRLDKNGPSEVTDHCFGYRHSLYSEGGTALSAVMKLSRGDPERIRERMAELAAKRRASQPLELPSAGSVFKRPEGYYAGRLIEDCGLKGASVGGAQVSNKHAGFIVNIGGATADDVKRLIELIQERVLSQFGVSLETEIKFM
ncbi:MAG: UDP-N-acetylmuramate dehydrogenase [Clostridia bacterium]|nr:UDP-N-acetylmuramate dehydrogenase [Clostridia bacterium]